MGDVLLWSVMVAIVAISLLVATVTLLVITRLRDLGGDPDVAVRREVWLSPDLSTNADLRALRD